MMPHRIINTEFDRQGFLRFIAGVSLPTTFEWRAGRDRTLDQNRLQFLWAREAAEQRCDTTADEVRCEWKLTHGLPILCEDSSEFRELYETGIEPLPYEIQIRLMRRMSITSEMTVRQMVRYLDAVERECLSNGIWLTDPDPELAAYQGRYRGKEAA